ncbi:MAG: glycosyltransferase family 4 protein [Desulfovibrionaceae bacterium]|nr:glycosyltransferase family 4 protein [Desulfovibrionaceae bacterium]
MRRILFCMEDLCFGGTQRQTVSLALRLDRSRFAPAFLVCTGPTDLDANILDAGLPIRYLASGRQISPVFFATMPFALVKEKPDLIVPCTAIPNIWARLWGKALSIPVLGTCRGGGGPTRQHERFLWRLTAHMVTNTEALRDDLEARGVPRTHVTVIQNGIDTETFRSKDTPSMRQPILLCVARLAKDKDHITLFKAFELVAQRVPDARLHVVGDGPEEKNLKDYAAAHPYLPIHFFPGTDNVQPHYAQARLLALSSVREGQPNVLLEAMSNSLPVCATAVGGIPALITHELTGLLSPAHDSVALADNLIRLLSHPDEGDRIGENARNYVTEHFSFERMVTAHEALFDRFART